MNEEVKELNQALLEIICQLETPPQGTVRTVTFPKTFGIDASTKAAEWHKNQLKLYSLKNNFERLGKFYKIPPALLAGKGSRESGLGATLVKENSIYWGWGDKSKRNGEEVESYHGFGVLQLDRKTAPFADVRNELNKSLGKVKLNPYEYKWLEWGVKTFLQKMKEIQEGFPKLKNAEQFATALSKYNGGKRGLTYPKNDDYTTGKDYASDTLIRAKWYAENWETI